jgi:Flp pilus assembly protein TadD
MKEFIQEMQADYDWVIVDTPPILFVSDASVMSVLCDGVIVVVKSGTSTRTLLHRAREQLDSVSANILGSILNNVTVSRMGRHTSSYYNYGYSRYAKDYKSLYYASEDTEPVLEESSPEPSADRVADAVAEPLPAPAPERTAPAAPVAEIGEAVAAPAPTSAPPASRYPHQIRSALKTARAGQIEQARELLQSLLAFEPNDLAVREALVKLELDAHLIDAAGRLARALLADDPHNPYALYVLGSLDIVAGDYRSAEPKLVDSVRRRPDPESLNNLAWLLNEVGRYAEAEPHVRQALEMNGADHRLWDTLGLILQKQGRVDDAARAFAEALKRDRHDICACLNMTENYLRQGRPRAARKLMRRLDARRNELLAAERTRLKNLETIALKS